MFTVFSLILLLFYLLQLGFFYQGWRRLKYSAEWQTYPELTIIIPVRNEEKHIESCLNSILSQEYPGPKFQILVIDDFSEDKTCDILRTKFEGKVRLIKLTDILPPERARMPNKKNAIAWAVNSAETEWVVCTDGDCEYGPLWLKTLADGMIPGTHFVTGPVLLNPSSGLFRKFQQLDVLSMMGITAASYYWKLPLMANGANMAFRRETFLQADAYSGTDRIHSGDDAFLMHHIDAKFPDGGLKFVKDPKAIVLTHSLESLDQFIDQRTRWLSKSASVPDKRITLILILNYLFVLTIFLQFISGVLFNPLCLAIASVSFAGKCLADGIFLYQLRKFQSPNHLLPLLPLFEIIYIPYVLLSGLLGLAGRYEWKGRKI